jgi:DNA-binding PadR family transcriptional regulator
MAAQSNVQASLPLTETTFFIMLSLVPAPKHGYSIMKDVQALSDKRVVLSTGTLYGALKRLLENNWIERVEDLGANETGRPRKCYRLTDRGRRILDAEIVRLQALVSTARLRTAEEQA